jgi:HD-like signal output (HDOD) protein
MFSAIRSGMTSILGALAAWWRARGGQTPQKKPRPARSAQSPDSRAAGDGPPDAAGDPLRQFLSIALDDGKTEPVAADGDVHHQRLVEQASAVLSRFEVQAKYLPRRPSLLPKLLSAMNSDSNSMRELASIIGGDPTLLGNLLRVANSAFYRVSGKPIESLERAVILVGTDGIRSIIATSLMHPVMSTAGGCFAKFPEAIWDQTQIAADAAELHATHVERADAFGARMLALLHGLAVNAVFRIVRDEILDGRESGAKPAMIELIERWTIPVALRIAASWELPDELQLALEVESAPQARSLAFGRLAGAQLSMVKRGRLKEAAARASVLAADTRRVQVDRVWTRLASAVLKTQPATSRR